MKSIVALSRHSEPKHEHWWRAVISGAITILAFTAIAPAQKPVAQLPNGITVTNGVYSGTTIDTTYSLPTGGTTWAAHTATDLRNALTGSAPGDVIVLDAGITYSGVFHLYAKTNPNNKWIYIISSQLATMPEGTRVSPANAPNMPKIATPNASGTIQIDSGANHWRLAGLELTAVSNYPAGCGVIGHPNCLSYNIMSTPCCGPTNPAVEPDSITIDRCYVHGGPTQELQSAIQMTASNYAVVDSYIDDVFGKGMDTSGLSTNWSPGPFKIVNNYVSASTENIIFGGAGGPNVPWVPSDIEIRNNWIYKPLAWVPLNMTQHLMTVKNAIEIKSAQRVLIDSNIIENVWAGGQAGFAVVLTVRSGQSGNIAVVNDITATNNVLKNVVAGFNTLAKDDTCDKNVNSYPLCTNAGSQDRWNISNNLVTFYDPTLLGGFRNALIQFNPGIDWPNGGITGQMRDVVFQHNTAVATASTPCWNSVMYTTKVNSLPPFSHITSNIWILDNVLCREPSGDVGQQGISGMTQYMGDPSTPPYDLTQRFYGNAMFVPPGAKVYTWPPHNLATTVPFTYVNPATGNYQLLTPYWTDTSDGQLAGVNNSTLP